MTDELSVNEKYNLITRDLQEVLHPDILKNVLSERPPRGYWGTAPTGSIHVGYLIPSLKLRDILNAGCELTILIADIHAFLDNLKTPYDKIKLRTKYYILMMKSILKTLNVNPDKVNFITGSEYQLQPEVTLHLYKLASITNTSQAIKAGTEVVKQNKDPKLTSLLYPLLQSLDEYFLNVDFEIGGIDQRKIFTYSTDHMSKIGLSEHKVITYLMNPIVPGLSTKPSTNDIKMSASDPNSKIDLLDTPEIIQKKISKAYCSETDIIDNSVLKLFKNLVFKLTNTFTFTRESKYGGNVTFDSYEALEKSYADNLVGPADLKFNLAKFLSEFLEPIRNEFMKEENMQLYKDAYAD